MIYNLLFFHMSNCSYVHDIPAFRKCQVFFYIFAGSKLLFTAKFFRIKTRLLHCEFHIPDRIIGNPQVSTACMKIPECSSPVPESAI